MTAFSAPGMMNLPRICWPVMSVNRFAALEQATGAKVIKMGDIWWCRVRPYFYRPLLPLKIYDLKTTQEAFDKVGAFQHRVDDRQPHNSYLNPIVFDELQTYDPKNLRHGVQRHIKKALRNGVALSRIVDEGDFRENAYPVYLSFYKRTKYAFDTSRRQIDGFARWAHTLFQFHEAVVLGAFVGQELVSFEISCLVENTLILKTSVHSDKALSLGVRDFILHHYRISTLEQPTIHEIYDGVLGRKRGINEFKVIRGAKVLALPSFLNARPIALWLLKHTVPSAYSLLKGLDNRDLRAANLAP